MSLATNPCIPCIPSASGLTGERPRFDHGSSLIQLLRAWRPSASRLRRTGDPELVYRQGLLHCAGRPWTGTLEETGVDGQLMARYQLRNGQLHGCVLRWHRNGELAEQRAYRRGKACGCHLGWWESGAARFEIQYRNGRRHGDTLEWFPSGALHREFHYRHGKPSGTQRIYRADGSYRANHIDWRGNRRAV